MKDENMPFFEENFFLGKRKTFKQENSVAEAFEQISSFSFRVFTTGVESAFLQHRGWRWTVVLK